MSRRTTSWPLARGQVIRAEVGLDEPKLFVVVSNNRRNNRLGDVLAARLTTSPKPPLPSIVELTNETLTGRVMCDDLLPIYKDEVVGRVAALSPLAMVAINRALASALDLPLPR
ncbi:MAG: type II toxin-antitoxin system PemK/MazF family toxin [Spirochaetes bacterium]|nr:MAG: type II toxin-antitoxin system PemK/MazF family toxin [Spirochaetota bacterium]